MARKSTRRSVSSSRHSRFQPRDLLLAGLGAVSIGRKQAAYIYENGIDDVLEMGFRAQDAVQSAAKTVSGKVASLRKQAKAKAAPVQRKVLALAKEAKAQARHRLEPVLVQLGLKTAPKKHTPARKKAPAVRTRKAA